MELKKSVLKVLTMLGKIVLAGVLAIVVLSVFCYLFCFSGVHIHNDSGATDYKWMPNQWKSTIFEGHAWLKMDENGFNNASGVQESTDILLMGSSHMEAVNIAPDKNVASLMNESLPLVTYNIGTSGHNIYTCVKNMDAALEQYDPDAYVILETSTVSLSVPQMKKVLDGTMGTIPSYDSGILFTLQKNVPAIKSIYKNLDDWRAADQPSVVVKPAAQDMEEYARVLREFIQKAASSAKGRGVTLIIFYHPQSKIDETGAYVNTTDPEKLALFSSACEEQSVVFVDMTQSFMEMYGQEHVLPHGFSNTAVGAGHLNAHGHRAIAQTLINKIKENSEYGA